MRKSDNILNFFSEKKEDLSPLLIFTHDYPDPDALASAFALQYLVENVYNIKSKIVYGGIIGRMENRSMVDILNIPVNKLTQTDFIDYTNIALVDTQPLFKNNSFPQDRRATIVIDQHKSVSKPNADLVVIDTKCGATCVIIAEALLSINADIPKSIATAITYGIISETLSLYRGTTKRVINTYLSILPKSDISALAQIQNPTRSKNFFKTLGIGIQNAILCGKLITANLGPVENPDLVSQITDFFLTYEGIDWALCTGRYKDSLHISLRSRQVDVNAGDILREVVGDENRAGGHNGIAGGSFEIGINSTESNWQEKEQLVLQRLGEKLQISTKTCTIFPFRTIIDRQEK